MYRSRNQYAVGIRRWRLPITVNSIVSCCSIRRWTLKITVNAIISCCRFSRNWDACLRTLDLTSFSRIISLQQCEVTAHNYRPLRLTKPAGHLKVLIVSASNWLKDTVTPISFIKGCPAHLVRYLPRQLRLRQILKGASLRRSGSSSEMQRAQHSRMMWWAPTNELTEMGGAEEYHDAVRIASHRSRFEPGLSSTK